jgi:hypothetical protein
MDGRGNYVKCMHLLREKNTLITGSHDGRLREVSSIPRQVVSIRLQVFTSPSGTSLPESLFARHSYVTRIRRQPIQCAFILWIFMMISW